MEWVKLGLHIFLNLIIEEASQHHQDLGDLNMTIKIIDGSQIHGDFDQLLLLKTSPEIFIQRIQNRTDNDFGKDKTAQDVILGWYERFEQKMIDKGAIVIDAEQSVDNVVEQILTLVNTPQF